MVAGANGNGLTSAIPNSLPNVSQAQYLEWIDAYIDCDESVKRAVDRRNKLRKEIETAGVKLPAMDLVRKLRDMSGDVREVIMGQTLRMLAWEHKEPGFQSSFDIANDPTADPDVRALHAHDLLRIEREGYEAGVNASRKRANNPYSPGTEQATRWDANWLRGDGERTGQTSPGGMAAGQTVDHPAAPGRRRGRPRKDATAAPPAAAATPRRRRRAAAPELPGTTAPETTH